MSIASSSSSVGGAPEQKGKLRCWSKGSENLQTQFCMAFTVDFTVYNFQIAHNERRWFVQKRYSEFDKLDSVVRSKASLPVLFRFIALGSCLFVLFTNLGLLLL